MPNTPNEAPRAARIEELADRIREGIYADDQQTRQELNEALFALNELVSRVALPAEEPPSEPVFWLKAYCPNCGETFEKPVPKPPSAEAVAWLREWINDDPRDGDGEPMMLDADDAMCQEYVRDILRFVENAPRNAHRPDNSAMHPDGRIGGTR